MSSQMMKLTEINYRRKNKTFVIKPKPKHTMIQKMLFQSYNNSTNLHQDCSSGYFKDNARIRLEQNNDIVLRNLRAKLKGNPFDENELASDHRHQHYLQNITRIEIKQEVLTRKYYTDTGTKSHCQILLPIQLLDEFLQALHGHNSNHPGITKRIQEAIQK